MLPGCRNHRTGFLCPADHSAPCRSYLILRIAYRALFLGKMDDDREEEEVGAGAVKAPLSPHKRIRSVGSMPSTT